MVKIYNSDCTKGLAKNAGIQTAVDKVPNELAEKIVPTFETNPELLRKSNLVRSSGLLNALSATIYTTPTNQDFYLTGFTMAYNKDATSTCITCRLICIINGLSTILMNFPTFTLTAEKDSVTMVLRDPILVDRGTNIIVTSNTNVANINIQSTIYGYIDEKSLA